MQILSLWSPGWLTMLVTKRVVFIWDTTRDCNSRRGWASFIFPSSLVFELLFAHPNKYCLESIPLSLRIMLTTYVLLSIKAKFTLSGVPSVIGGSKQHIKCNISNQAVNTINIYHLSFFDTLMCACWLKLQVTNSSLWQILVSWKFITNEM